MTVSALRPVDGVRDFAAPCYLSRVAAGFPNPAADYMDRKLDLNEFLIRHPAATFYCWTQGESMEGVGIFDGDLLIVDRAEEPMQHDIVLAYLDGGLTCKLFDKQQQRLCSAHRDYPPFPIKANSQFQIEGVVVHSIRMHRVRAR